MSQELSSVDVKASNDLAQGVCCVFSFNLEDKNLEAAPDDERCFQPLCLVLKKESVAARSFYPLALALRNEFSSFSQAAFSASSQG